jgi:translation elongation factor EF-G
VQFEVRDAKIIPDAAHRGAGQIIPAAKKAMKAAVAAAGPCLLEPLLSYVPHPSAAKNNMPSHIRLKI